MVEGLKHTSAAEQEEFVALPQATQLLRIWLNGKETNGAVAEAHEKIDLPLRYPFQRGLLGHRLRERLEIGRAHV